MPKKINIVMYECSICHGRYLKESEAIKCESKIPDRCPVIIGDIVKILKGEEAGTLRRVEDIYLLSRHDAYGEYGHHEWRIRISSISNEWCRCLSPGDYELIINDEKGE